VIALKEGKLWSDEDEKMLMLLRKDGHVYKVIGPILGRTTESCRKKYNKTRWEDKPYYSSIDTLRQNIWDHAKTVLLEKTLTAYETKCSTEQLKTELLADALERSIKALPTVCPPVCNRKRKKKHGSEDVGLMLSDLHIGHSHTLEETGGLSEYNKDIFLKRMDRLKYAVDDIVELHSHLYDLPVLHIFCLGDIVAGMNAAGKWSNVFIEMDIMAQFAEGVESLGNMIYYFLGIFKEIHFYGVIGNHGRSLSKHTRILTPFGYRGYDQIEKGNLVGSMNMRSGKFEWQKVRNKNIYTKKGKMVSIKKKKFAMTVTDDHDVLRQSRKTGKFSKIKAEDITHSRTSYIIPICRPSHNKEYHISDEMLSVLGWVMSDGHYLKKCNTIHIYQSKPNMRDHMVSVIKTLYKDIHVRCRRKNVKEILGTAVITQEEECCINLRASDLSKQIRYRLPERESVPSWMWDLSDRQVEILMEALVDGDGTRRQDRKGKDGYVRRGGVDTIWGKKKFLEQLMGLFVSHDISCSIHKHKRKNPKILKSGEKQQSYYLQFKKSKRYMPTGDQFNLIDYDDIAWCVTVDNGTIAVLDEHGFPYFTGNCAPQGVEKPGANWDYLAYDSLRLRFLENKQVKFHIPHTWWLKTTIRNHKFLIVHGDDVKGAVLPLNGLRAFVDKWASVANFIPNYTMAGHFHTMAELSTAQGKLMVNGSFIGPDIYALKTLHAASPPEQKIFGIHGRRGITWKYDIDLRDNK